MNFPGIIPTAQKFAATHTKELYLGGIVTANIATAVVSAMATHKADAVVFNEEVDRGRRGEPDMTTKEKALVYAKYHIPTALCVGSHAGMAVTVYSSAVTKELALTEALAIETAAGKAFKEATIAEVSDKTLEAIKNRSAESAIREKTTDCPTVVSLSGGESPCLDIQSGRIFATTKNKLDSARNELNSRMLDEVFIYLNDYYIMVGLEPTPSGWELGWDVTREGLVDFNIATTLDSEGRPILTVDPTPRPKPKYY